MSGAEEARTVMSAAHLIYIPLCVLVGAALGWLLGTRSARGEIERLRRALEEDERRERAARLVGGSNSPTAPPAR